VVAGLTAIAILVLSGTVVYTLARCARATDQKLSLLLLVVGLIVCVTLGTAFGVLARYQLADHVRVQGFPIPLVIWVRENGRWTDFVQYGIKGYLCIAANVMFPVIVLGGIVHGCRWIKGRRIRNARGSSQSGQG